jgi:uncharacterized membrane protein
VIVRIIAGILAILAILPAAAGGVLMLDDVAESQQLVEETEAIVGELPAEEQAEYATIVAQQQNTAYALFGASVLGLIGAVLAFMGKGKIAAALLLISGILPYVVRLEAVVFIFSGLFILAAVVAFFAQKKAAAPTTTEPTAAPAA